VNVLSLFDGMSCGQIALERAGIKTKRYFASEIEPNAIMITQKNYPNTIQLGDVTKWHEWELPKIDLLIGGSPCQGFSHAGKQLNFNDPRSKLFFEFVDIKNTLKPKYFLLENVKMKKEYQDIISEYLGVEPVRINSSLVSAQLRNRFYWTNIPYLDQPEDKGILLQDIIESGYVDREKSLCIREAESRPHTDLEKMFKRYKEKSFSQIVYCGKDLNPKNIRMLTQTELEKLQTVPVGYTQPLKRNEAASLLGNGWTVDVITHIFEGLRVHLLDEFYESLI
jgi:site-specific DNA-cytosine methylase